MTKNDSLTLAFVALGLLLVTAAPASAQYQADWWTVDGGGAMGLSGGAYSLDSTAGQPDAHAAITGGTYSLTGGFWQGGVATYYDLSVALAGNGGGSVASSPGGITCGSDCVESFADGTPVTLTASADVGSAFGGWSGACAGTASTCDVTMSQARSVTATFTLNTYALSVTKAGSGGGLVTSIPAGIDCGSDCSETFGHGSDVTLTAAATAGSWFQGWGDACSGAAATCVVTMDGPKSATATFALLVSGFHTVVPCRFFDTRDASLGGPDPLTGGSTRLVPVAGHCGVPATARSVSVNVTATQPSTAGYLTLYAAGITRPSVSVLNFSQSQTRGNNAVVSLGSAGDMVVFAGLGSGSTHVIVDVNGYFE